MFSGDKGLSTGNIDPTPVPENDLNAPFLAPDAQVASASHPDLLSQVLSLVRLRGRTVTPVEIGDQWVVDAGSLGRFYVVEQGTLLLRLAESRAVLVQGDVVLLLRGGAHSLEPTPDVRATSRCKCIAGAFHIDSGTLPPVLASLPDLIHVPAPASGIPPWLVAISRFLVEEAMTPAPGAELMVSRLIDLLVIRALRSWSTGSGGRFALVAALGDERLSKALSAMHTAPTRPWTVPELAAVASMSRSSFARHFNAILGEPPLRYLVRWRLHLASEMLRSGTVRVGEVAQRVGYASEAAFSRAFKACFGHSPKQAANDMVSAPSPQPR